MPRSTIQELRATQDVEQRLVTNTTRTAGAAKIGSTTSYYMYVDPTEVRLKSNGIGMIMNKELTTIQPGASLSFQVPYQKVDFNKMYFHPAADVSSTAVFPHPTFTQCWNDPAIKLVNGVYSAIRSLAGA
jgi:hypothetical protein